MALYQKGENWGVDWRDEWNRRHRKLVGTKSAAELLELNLQQTSQLARAALRTAEKTPALDLRTAIDLWLAHSPTAPSTKQHHRERLEPLLAYLGNQSLGALTPKILEEFQAHARERLAPSTLARDAARLQQLFRWLVREHYLASSPAETLDSKYRHVPTARILSYQEEGKILQALTPRTTLRVLLALDAGLRRGEANALRKNHCDFPRRTLTIWAPKTRTTRILPLTRRLETVLRAHAAGLAPDSLLSAYGERPILKGTDFLKFLWPKVGFHFRFHDLRHTFATRLAAATSNPFVVSALLGHSLYQTVFWHRSPLPHVTRRYVTPPLEELRAAVLEMENRNPNTPQETP